MSLRPAEDADVRLVFGFRNDPLIVERSSSRRAVTWPEHEAWFAASLGHAERLIRIVLVDGRPAGLVRFDREGCGSCVISAYLLEPFTGQGHGVEAIRQGCGEAFASWDVDEVVACVREDNAAGASAFLKAGFEGADGGAPCPPRHRRYVLPRRPAAWRDDDARTARHFAERLRQHGPEAASVGWGSRASQQLRFTVLAGVGLRRGDRVLDVGCGKGDLLEWLEEAGLEVDYTGLDVTPAMVEACRARFPGRAFHVGTLADLPAGLRPPFDVVLASGLFYLRQHRPLAFMEETVRDMFAACRRAAAFNSLSTWAADREGDEFHADPLETLRWCRRLTPHVVLRHDYKENDFTVYLRRGPGADVP